MSAFKIHTLTSFFFQKLFKKERKFTWKHGVILSLLGVFIALGIWLYVLLAPFQEFFWKLPSMLGFLGERNYLILIQNNSERRPTGGFITAYGELSFFLGIPSFHVKDSYDINAPQPQIEPPYPLNQLLKDDVFYKGFVFRDSNWSPDFPTSVQTIKDLYFKGQSDIQDVSGVIAIDITSIEKLVDLIGGVTIDGQVFNSRNLFHELQMASKNINLHSEEDLKNRKNVMKDIAPQLLKKTILHPLSYPALIQTFKVLLDTKHVLLNFTKDTWQDIVVKNGWSGSLESKTPDFIHVNVANIGGRKADRYIEPRYRYMVTFDQNGQGHAQLDLDWTHMGTQGLYSDFYQAYIRTYIPATASNVKYSGDAKSPWQTGNEFNAQFLGTLVHIWPGETQSLHFTYDIPAEAMALDYRLSLMPQAGSFGENWEVILRNQNVDHFWSSDDFKSRENVAVYHNLFLQKNTILHASLLEDKTPPIIISQKFLDKDTIQLDMSEPLDASSLEVKNFSLIDTNEVQPSIQETPVIGAVFQDEKYHMFIKLSGLSWQIGERFLLTMTNVKDLSGNFTVPQKKEITVVQR